MKNLDEFEDYGDCECESCGSSDCYLYGYGHSEKKPIVLESPWCYECRSGWDDEVEDDD